MGFSLALCFSLPRLAGDLSSRRRGPGAAPHAATSLLLLELNEAQTLLQAQLFAVLPASYGRCKPSADAGPDRSGTSSATMRKADSPFCATSNRAAEYTCMHCGDMFYHKSYRQPNLAYGAYFACTLLKIWRLTAQLHLNYFLYVLHCVLGSVTHLSVLRPH